MKEFYQLSANNLQGQATSMQDYAGKVILVVNTASHCGFTPQYKGLQDLHAKYADQDLVVLGFPCDQFGHQESGDSETIGAFCEKNYGVTFPIFEKIKVNGSNAHPVFRYLRDQLPGLFNKSVKWNFTKFLIGRNGEPIKRFAPTTKPEKLESAIRRALDANLNQQEGAMA